MAYVAAQRIKHNGTWYPPGTPLPRLSKTEREYFDANGLGVETVTAAEVASANALQAKIDGLRAAAQADTERAESLRADATALEPQFADLPNLRRAATKTAKGDDDEATAAANAAVEAAEAAQTRHGELLAEAEGAEAQAAAKLAALEALA